MTEELNTAFLVMGVGMATVFSILSLVVLTGKLLIRLVNRFAPEPVLVQPKLVSQQVSGTEQSISPSVMAAIIATVEQVTGGKGRIDKIEPNS